MVEGAILHHHDDDMFDTGFGRIRKHRSYCAHRLGSSATKHQCPGCCDAFEKLSARNICAGSAVSMVITHSALPMSIAVSDLLHLSLTGLTQSASEREVWRAN